MPIHKKIKKQRRDDDDSSVDSHGNIRDLIAYEDSSENMDSSWRESGTSDESPKYRGKKNKPPTPQIKGRKGKPKVVVESDEEEEVAPTPVRRRIQPTLVRAAAPGRRGAIVEDEELESPPSRRLRQQQKKDEDSELESPPSRRHRRPARIEEEEDEEESVPESPPKRRRAAIKAEKRIAKRLEEEEALRRYRRRRLEEEAEEEEEDDEEDEEDEEDEIDIEDTDDETDEDDEDLEDEEPQRSGIELLISDLGEAMRPQKPKKYKMSKEPENVRRFVRLVQTEVDPNEEDIDRDIGYFKSLTPRAQDRLLTKLQHKVEPDVASVPLKFQILAKEVPEEVERVAMAKFMALQNIDPSTTEYYKTSQWIQGYTQLPLGLYKDLPVKLEDGTEKCQAFMSNVRKCMDDAIYGHDEAKLQIMQFVSSWIANPQGAGNVLSIHGPPGVGKTTLVKDGVAKALGRPFHFITLGGATDASFLDGHSYTYEGSTWGRIVDVLIKSKCMNPVIYFDELDKVSETPKGEEINNLLIHLTDGSQNDRFQDKYFTGIDLDLSRCLFIFSHNAHEKVNPILRDRMYNIQVNGFNLKEKLVISEQYLINSALREVNLFEKISINKDIVTHIIENFTGEEPGVRELKRCIQTVISKLNLLRFYNDPARVPFAIKDFALPFTLKKDHIDLFLKKKPSVDESIAHLYV
jgi:hypothetical protein